MINPMSAREERQDGVCAPALLHLSPALPSSLGHLGLTFSNTQPLSTPSATPNTNSSIASNTQRSAANAPPSLRVCQIHFDDVAQDAILVCEDNITLFVPLDCDAPASIPNTNFPSAQQQQQQGKEKAALVSAVAACLHLGNPNQAWVTEGPVQSSTCSPTYAISTSVNDNCLPRRLPVPADVLRRAPSVLVAVPILALSSSSVSAAAASGAAGNTAGTVISVVIVECAVLPEGVDFIEPGAIPLAKPVKKILCAPSTLRFREAWYPIQHFCWCGPRETLSLYGRNAMKQNASRQSATKRAEHGREHGDVDDNGDTGRREDEMSSPLLDHVGVDYHLLCVSSICVDLLRIHCRSTSLIGENAPRTDDNYGPPHQPDVSVMMNSGYAVRDHAPGPLQQATTARASSSKNAAAAAAATLEEEDVVVTLMQRYVTRTDWCFYEPRSRVLLSINHTRPDVLKPMEVSYEVCGSTAVSTASEAVRGDGSYDRQIAASQSSPSHPTTVFASVKVTLCKWAELTLPESLCASLYLPSPLAALPQDPRIARLLHSVVGLFTTYGHTFLYHMPSTLRSGGQPLSPCLDVYLFLPNSTGDATPKPASLTPPSSAPFSAPSMNSPRGVGFNTTGLHGEAADSLNNAAQSATPSSFPSSPSDFFKRLKMAVSSATASAAPPQALSGIFVKVGKLSLRELLPSYYGFGLPTQPSVGSPASPIAMSSASPTAGAFSPLSSTTRSNDSGATRGRMGYSPLPLQLSLQVCNDLIILHNTLTNKSAVYDLAERSDEAGSFRANADNGSLSSRDILLCATASERSRRWVRGQHSRAVAPASSSSPDYSHNDGVSLHTGPPNLQRTINVSLLSNSSAPFIGNRERDQVWTSAAAGDWTSMMSGAANSALEFSSAVEALAGYTTTNSVTTTAGPTARAALSMVDAQAPRVHPLCCCTATVDIPADTRVTQSSVGESALQKEVETVEDARSIHRITKKVLYSSCAWPSSSRTPLVISKHDGSLRRCQVDLVGAAEWMLLQRTPQASPSLCPPFTNVSSNSSRLAPSAAATAAAQANIVSASLRQFVAFACRHSREESPSHNVNERSDDEENNESTGDTVDSFMKVLRELTSRLVLGECRTVGSAHHQSYESDSSSYSAVLQLHLTLGATALPAALFDFWNAVFEGLTLEAMLVERFTSLAQQRTLASCVPSNSLHDTGIFGKAVCNSNECGKQNKGDEKSGGVCGQLQGLLVKHVWLPVWRDLKYQKSLCEIVSGSADLLARHCTQQPQQQQRRRQRCEDLLCAYVRLLRRLGVPTLQTLQELVLEVVLRCDSVMGSIVLNETPATAAAATAHEDSNTNNNNPISASFIEALTASACRTARRVRELLRQGVLEENITTARSLLSWWEHLRYQLVTAQQEARDRRQKSSEGSERQVGWEAEQPDFLSDSGCPEAEALFQEAVRLFTLQGRQLEVAEAFCWRRDYAAAATLLQRLPRNTPPIELCEVHGVRRSLAATSTSTQSRSTSCIQAAETATSHSGCVTQRCTPRLLSWDTLAVTVLDGAWRALQEAEEASYVLAERMAAVARSAGTPARRKNNDQNAIASTEGDSPAASPASPNSTALFAEAPPTWQLRAAERAMRAAYRLYLSVAAVIFAMPGLPPTLNSTATVEPSPAAPAVVAEDPTTEFNLRFTEEGIRGVPRNHPLHPHYTHYNPVSNSVSTCYRTHEVRYLQLRQQVEMEWHHMKTESAV